MIGVLQYRSSVLQELNSAKKQEWLARNSDPGCSEDDDDLWRQNSLAQGLVQAAFGGLARDLLAQAARE